MSGYGQYCPVAKAAEVLGEKWSILILRELCVEDQNFNNLKKGMPLVSPTMLSKRLKTLVSNGVIERLDTETGVYYSLTEAGEELKEIIMQLGVWGQKWVRSKYTKSDLDASLLMWDLHRTIKTKYFPKRKTVVQFEFLGVPNNQRLFWLVVENNETEVCIKNPGYDIDLSIKAYLRDFTAFWMGDLPMSKIINSQKLKVEGDVSLKKSMNEWLCGSEFSEIMPG